MDDLEYLRSLEKVVSSVEFTYFNHYTSYLPAKIQKRMINGNVIEDGLLFRQIILQLN